MLCVCVCAVIRAEGDDITIPTCGAWSERSGVEE